MTQILNNECNYSFMERIAIIEYIMNLTIILQKGFSKIYCILQNNFNYKYNKMFLYDICRHFAIIVRDMENN